MNASLRIPASTSVARRALAASALIVLASLLLMVPGGARAAGSATTAKVKAKFDRLSIMGAHSGILVRGSVLPGSKHVKARVSLYLRRGNGAFKKVQTLKLGPNDRNFALLDHVAPGAYSVKVGFSDPGVVQAATSQVKKVVVQAVFGHPMSPGSLRVSNGVATYSASVPAPKSATQVQLLGLDDGPAAGSVGNLHTASKVFKVLATTTVPASTSTASFTLSAKLMQGQRWTLLLVRTFGHDGAIDYAGLKTVRVS